MSKFAPRQAPGFGQPGNVVNRARQLQDGYRFGGQGGLDRQAAAQAQQGGGIIGAANQAQALAQPQNGFGIANRVAQLQNPALRNRVMPNQRQLLAQALQSRFGGF